LFFFPFSQSFFKYLIEVCNVSPFIFIFQSSLCIFFFYIFVFLYLSLSLSLSLCSATLATHSRNREIPSSISFLSHRVPPLYSPTHFFLKLFWLLNGCRRLLSPLPLPTATPPSLVSLARLF